jgi:cell division protein FtsL
MKTQAPNRSNTRTIALWLGMAFMAIFILELLIYTWCRVQCTRIGYEITQTQNCYQQLLTTKNSLKIELARLKSPERIARKAKEELGLVMPTSKQMVVMP